MKEQSKSQKIRQWLFRLTSFGGFLGLDFATNTGMRVLCVGFLLLGVVGLVLTSGIGQPDSSESFAPAEANQMKMPAEWQRAYESFARFLIGRAGSRLFVAGWFSLLIVMFVTKRQTILGFSLGRVALIWFFGYILLTIIGSFLGWEEMAERQQRDRKLKPIPQRGEKVELYDFETGQPLAHISGTELQFLIDSFQEWGMADNDFFIMRETVDLFEERGADAHLVATLKEMMGKKHEMEIGWTLV